MFSARYTEVTLSENNQTHEKSFRLLYLTSKDKNMSIIIFVLFHTSWAKTSQLLCSKGQNLHLYWNIMINCIKGNSSDFRRQKLFSEAICSDLCIFLDLQRERDELIHCYMQLVNFSWIWSYAVSFLGSTKTLLEDT